MARARVTRLPSGVGSLAKGGGSSAPAKASKYGLTFQLKADYAEYGATIAMYDGGDAVGANVSRMPNEAPQQPSMLGEIYLILDPVTGNSVTTAGEVGSMFAALSEDDQFSLSKYLTLTVDDPDAIVPTAMELLTPEQLTAINDGSMSGTDALALLTPHLFEIEAGSSEISAPYMGSMSGSGTFKRVPARKRRY